MTRPSKTLRKRRDGLHTSSRHLESLGAFLAGAAEAGVFFDAALKHVLEQVGVDHALLVRLAPEGLQVVWAASLNGETDMESLGPLETAFCQEVLAHPSRMLILKDVREHTRFAGKAAHDGRHAGAFLGVALRQGDRPMGVLLVLNDKKREFTKPEVAMVAIMAGILGHALEVEQLRYDLQVTREALDLATAIVEDSSIESPVSGLPNGHYLDIWLKANLYLARRRGESLVLVTWSTEPGPRLRALVKASRTLRGEDLLVDLGHHRFLLILPRTTLDGAARPVAKIRDVIGDVPMGGTVWDPTDPADAADPTLHLARVRAEAALRDAAALGVGLAWSPGLQA